MGEKSEMSIEEFGRLADGKDYVSLIRDWQDQTFHAAFTKTAAGNDVPVLREVQGRGAFIAGPDRKAVESELDGLVVLAGSGDVFIKPVPLQELARNAARLRAWITWGGSNGGVIVDSILHVLGLSAIVKDVSGDEYLYRAEVFELKTVDASEEDRIGAVTAQNWTISPIVQDREGEVYDKRLVYDDEDVTLFREDADPLDVPVPRTDLTPEEQALFDRWQKPVYSFAVPDTRDHPVAAKSENDIRHYEKYILPLLAISLVVLLIAAYGR